MTLWRGLAITTVAALGGCYNAGPYGYDHYYVPLDYEDDLVETAQEAVFNEVRTDPEDFGGTLISWFGVVEQVDAGEGGASIVRLSFRTHQERHLCFEEERNTCRVTVSQASAGTFTARVRLRPEDQQGQNSIGSGSLLRVYCHVTGEFDAEGGPLLDCEQYRHWPRGQWAHTGMRGQMRR
jgi:hypothetical protein